MWLLRATLLFEGLVRAACWNEFRKLGKLVLHRQSFLAPHCFNFPQHLLQFILLQKLWFSGDSYFSTVFLHLCPIFSHFLYWTHPCPHPQVDNVIIVQSLNHVQLFVTPWIAACQAFLSFTISHTLLKLMSIESVIPSSHLIFCCPLLLLPSIFLRIRVFPNESTLYC